MSGAADEGFGAHPFGEIARATVAAQERSLELAQAWSGSLQQLVSDQAEGGRAALEALTSTLAATEKALASQEEANRALRQSLEAYRAVIERASATQERTTRAGHGRPGELRRHHPGPAGADQGVPGPDERPARGLREPWSRAGTTPSCGCSRPPPAPGRGGPSPRGPPDEGHGAGRGGPLPDGLRRLLPRGAARPRGGRGRLLDRPPPGHQRRVPPLRQGHRVRDRGRAGPRPGRLPRRRPGPAGPGRAGLPAQRRAG